MKKFSYIAMLFVALFIAGAHSIQAQTLATMPLLYDQNGAAVNTTANVALPAGYYYIGGGPAQGGHQVDYYGNGIYYDMTTQTYGGSVHNPNGTAGVVLVNTAPGSGAVGVPNTGMGGMAFTNWLILIGSAGVFLASVAFGVSRTAA